MPEEIADLLSKKMEQVQSGDLAKYKSVLNGMFDDSIRQTIKNILGVKSYGYEIGNNEYREKLRRVTIDQINKYIEEFKDNDLKDYRGIFQTAYKTHLNTLVREAAKKKAEEDFNNFIGAKNNER